MERVKLKPKKVARVKVVKEPPSADFAARRVLVQSFLYYVMDSPTISDAEYDKLSRFVADHWDEVHRDRRWAMGDPEATRHTGSHFKFTQLVVSAALAYHKYKTGEILEVSSKYPWRETRKGLKFMRVGDPKPDVDYTRRS